MGNKCTPNTLVSAFWKDGKALQISQFETWGFKSATSDGRVALFGDKIANSPPKIVEYPLRCAVRWMHGTVFGCEAEAMGDILKGSLNDFCKKLGIPLRCWSNAQLHHLSLANSSGNRLFNTGSSGPAD
jgi:hypothetical protein